MSKDEYWKFSSPARLTSKELQNQLSFSDSNQAVIQSDNEINIFFVDGILDENLSDLQVNENLEIFSMNDNKASELLWVQELYGEVEAASQKRTNRALSAFNTACAEHGLFVRAKRGGKHKLVVNYIGKESDSDSLIHHLIKLEHDSNLVLIEKGEGASRLNRLIEIELLSSSTATFNSCIFKNNRAGASNAAESGKNGGVAKTNGSNTLTFNNCLFHENIAKGLGPIYGSWNASGTVTFNNCTMEGNVAYNGNNGFSYNWQGTVNLRNSIVRNTMYGGSSGIDLQYVTGVNVNYGSKDADAANKAGLFTLNGGFTLFKLCIISFEAYPHPILNPAKP